MSRERAERDAQPPIDLKSVIGGVVDGDQDAATELYGYLQPKLYRFFVRRLPIEAEDLTQGTIAEIMGALPKFDPELLIGGDLERSFGGWTFTIAKSALNMELRRVIGKNAAPFSDVTVGKNTDHPLSMSEMINDTGITDHSQNVEEEVFREEQESLMPAFKEKLGELLNPAQLEVVLMRMEGIGIDEIVEKSGNTRKAVINKFYGAREKIEGELIYPAGYKRVADFNDQTLSHAASFGRMEAVKILGLWYTKDEWVQRYNLRRRTVDPSMKDQEYVLLTEGTSNDEYGTLLGTRYTHLLTRHQGRIYITREGLESFRKNRTRVHKQYKPTDQIHKRLTDFAANPTEYNRLLNAANAGDIPAIKKGKWWLVKPEDMEEYLARVTISTPSLQSGDKRHSNSRREIVLYDASKLRELPEGDFPTAFRDWFFTTAKIVSDQRLSWNKRKKLPQPGDLDQAIDTFVAQVFEWLKKRSPRHSLPQRDILEAKLRGRASGEIATNLGLPKSMVNSRAGYYRSVLEDILLDPAGIKRVVDYRDERLSASANAGILEAVWFMGRWYTTDDRVEKYRAGRKDAKTLPVDQG